MEKQNYLKVLFITGLLLLSGLLQAASKDESLFYAARAGQHQLVASLIKQGANVNYANQARETPMHVAASTGQTGVMQYLRSQGARHNVATVHGWYPIHHAVRFGHVGAARYLLQLGSPVYAKTREGKNVFDIADATRNRAMIQLLQGYRR